MDEQLKAVMEEPVGFLPDVVGKDFLSLAKGGDKKKVIELLKNISFQTRQYTDMCGSGGAMSNEAAALLDTISEKCDKLFDIVVEEEVKKLLKKKL